MFLCMVLIQLENNELTGKKIILCVSLIGKCFCCSIFNYQDWILFIGTICPYCSEIYQQRFVKSFIYEDFKNLGGKKKKHYSPRVASKNCESLNCLCSTWLPQMQILVHSREQTLLSLLAKPCDLWPMNWRQLSWISVHRFWFAWDYACVKSNQASGGGGVARRVRQFIHWFGPGQPTIVVKTPSFLSKTVLFYTCYIWI